MKQSLYVITHKKVENIYPEDRKIMLVGSKDKEIPAGYYADYSAGKPNISEKNKNYCELTGLYYFVNNDENAEVFGLEHYRRLFVKRKFYLFKFPFLKEKDVNKILSKNDIIIPKPTYIKETLLESYSTDHVVDDLNKIGDIIKKKYPDYLKTYNDVLNNHKVYYCNMFIGKKEVVLEYCNWLFDILFELEKMIDIKDRDSYQQRVFGFLSERMFTIWLEKHIELKKYECNIEFIEDKPLKNIVRKIKRKLSKIFKKSPT